MRGVSREPGRVSSAPVWLRLPPGDTGHGRTFSSFSSLHAVLLEMFWLCHFIVLSALFLSDNVSAIAPHSGDTMELSRDAGELSGLPGKPGFAARRRASGLSSEVFGFVAFLILRLFASRFILLIALLGRAAVRFLNTSQPARLWGLCPGDA